MSELREAIARAIWEAWRMSVIAPEDYRDFSWEELCDLAAKYPDCAPGKFKEVALIESDAALAAIEARGMVVVPVTTIHGALNKLDDLWDEGPPGEGWQSDELVKIVKELESALPGARTEG